MSLDIFAKTYSGYLGPRGKGSVFRLHHVGSAIGRWLQLEMMSWIAMANLYPWTPGLRVLGEFGYVYMYIYICRDTVYIHIYIHILCTLYTYIDMGCFIVENL